MKPSYRSSSATYCIKQVLWKAHSLLCLNYVHGKQLEDVMPRIELRLHSEKGDRGFRRAQQAEEKFTHVGANDGKVTLQPRQTDCVTKP